MFLKEILKKKKLKEMPELSKFETLRTQLNENKVKEVMSFGQIC